MPHHPGGLRLPLPLEEAPHPLPTPYHLRHDVHSRTQIPPTHGWRNEYIKGEEPAPTSAHGRLSQYIPTKEMAFRKLLDISLIPFGKRWFEVLIVETIDLKGNVMVV